MKQGLAILGSTGSIGRQALSILRDYPDNFEAVTLTSNDNWELLASQAIEFLPDSVVIANKAHYPNLKEVLANRPVKVYAGSEAVAQIVNNSNIDTVLNSIVGYAGLEPTVATLKAGKKLALANKESLVAAGKLVMRLSAENNAPILPVDSEHSAIFQCLVGESNPVKRMILTASGGPFLRKSVRDLENVTVKQALDHPNWEMGAKITIDSATMMNKGFEVIEARWLFDIPPQKIDVLIHPQSAVHSFVEFNDGALKAQVGTADMRLPIQYALTFPHRWSIENNGFDFLKCSIFEFEQPDTERFRCLSLAYDCLSKGGNSCCVLNAANEVAVNAFLSEKIKFTDIPRIIETVLCGYEHIGEPSLEELSHCDRRARRMAQEASGI